MDRGSTMNHGAPIPKRTNFDSLNVSLLLVVGAAGTWLLVAEGYASLVRLPFLVYVIVVALGALWFAAFEVSRKRLVAIFVVAGSSGYLTQYVGATLDDVWEYAGVHHTYYFVPAMFVFASTLAYGLTSLTIGPRLRPIFKKYRRGANLAVVGVVVLVLLVTSVQYRGGPAFYAYYGALSLFALYASVLMDLGTLVSLILAALIVGMLSESLGAASGLWRFTGTGWRPPAYLVLGSWPLEIILHYGLSALLTHERLLAHPRYFRESRLFEPHMDHPMWTGDKKHLVASVVGEDKFAALEEVLKTTGFFDVVERRASALKKSKESLKIVVKPNFMFMYSEKDHSTYTDPSLVEYLIDRLREHGYQDIALVEAQSAYGNYFLYRDVPNVARIVGYAPKGRYRIVDLTAEKVPHRFPEPLGDHFVGPTWRDADFRISFAKNKTHTWAWYTLTLKNIYGALAMQDKIREYHNLREIYFPTIDMLIDFPVHFGLVDAFVSSDGPFGIFADRHPKPTKTILGGECLLAVDWVGASKMGLHPMISRYMELAVQAFGKPEIEVVGDASVYSPWCNVEKPLIDFWDVAEESYGFTNTVFSILNHDYMSPQFRRRPMTRFVGLLNKLFSPLGGLIYQGPSKRDGSPSDGSE